MFLKTLVHVIDIHLPLCSSTNLYSSASCINNGTAPCVKTVLLLLSLIATIRIAEKYQNSFKKKFNFLIDKE